MPTDVCVSIQTAADIVNARQQGRALASSIGFEGTDLTVIATAISEITRNIIEYAHRGELTLRARNEHGREGLEIIAMDEGPGIANVMLAMQDGYTTSKGLGLGLPGAKRLMDDFSIESHHARGTTVRMVKWLPNARA